MYPETDLLDVLVAESALRRFQGLGRHERPPGPNNPRENRGYAARFAFPAPHGPEERRSKALAVAIAGAMVVSYKQSRRSAAGQARRLENLRWIDEGRHKESIMARVEARES
jgi:hypothetical protein